MVVPRRYWVVYLLLNSEHLSKVQTYLRNRYATQYTGIFMLSNVRKRCVCVCTHTIVPILNLVRILNLVHVLNLDLVRILNLVGPRH